MAKRWQKKEARDARQFNGRVTPRSGGFFSFSGDVKAESFLIESKFTEKKSFSVSGKLWEKINNEAIKNRRTPMLSIELAGVGIELVILDKNDFLSLFKRDGVNKEATKRN